MAPLLAVAGCGKGGAAVVGCLVMELGVIAHAVNKKAHASKTKDLAVDAHAVFVVKFCLLSFNMLMIQPFLYMITFLVPTHYICANFVAFGQMW